MKKEKEKEEKESRALLNFHRTRERPRTGALLPITTSSWSALDLFFFIYFHS